jgi:hypothetical protein
VEWMGVHWIIRGDHGGICGLLLGVLLGFGPALARYRCRLPLMAIGSQMRRRLHHGHRERPAPSLPTLRPAPSDTGCIKYPVSCIMLER